MRIDDPATWRRLALAALRAGPPGTRTVLLQTRLSIDAWNWRIRHDGETDRITDRARRTELHTALQEIASAFGRRVGVEVAYGPDGGRVQVVEPTDAMDLGVGRGLLSDIVLVPGARPEPYRRGLRTHDVPYSPLADPEAVRSLVARSVRPVHGRGTTPATEEEIRDVERRWGVSLPPDVRALYLAAGAGCVDLTGGTALDDAEDPDDEDFDEDFDEDDDEPEEDQRLWGLEIMPLTGRGAREPGDWTTTEGRARPWWFTAEQVVAPDPEGRVQHHGHSPMWFPIATSGGGDVYAVDLAPGPRGTVGQILYLDHSSGIGAEWAAASLTELLTGRPNPDDFVRPADAGHLVWDLDTSTGPEDIAPQVEVLRCNRLAAVLDLTPLTGHPRIRSLTVPAEATEVRGLEALVTLPALEYLDLPLASWRRLLEIDAVPGSLLAVGFTNDGPWDPEIEIADVLLSRWGHPPMTRYVVDLPPWA